MDYVRKIIIALGLSLMGLCLFLAYACFVLWLNSDDYRNEIVSAAGGLVWLASAGVTFYWTGRADRALRDEIVLRKKERNKRVQAEIDAARARVRSRNSH